VAEPDENDVLNLIASAPLQFPPGSSWAYCNSCYALLADVVELEGVLCGVRRG